MNVIVFDLGEKKHVKLRVHSTDPEAEFMIDSASWQLLQNGNVVDEGIGTIDNNAHTIDIMLSPKVKTKHVLRVTYAVADEILVDRMEVVVRE